jgi:nucleotide-binding universal stress UspA family protein
VVAVRRVIVGVHGSLGSLQALRHAADEARERAVPLVPVIAWIPPGGDLAERGHPAPYLRQVWKDAARERLFAAFEDGLGGLPADLAVVPTVARGDTGPVLVDIADQPGDLLVIGTGRRSLVGRALRKSVGRYCLAHAKCPVLAVPPSALMDEMGHGRRHWTLRHHALMPDISELSDK